MVKRILDAAYEQPKRFYGKSHPLLRAQGTCPARETRRPDGCASVKKSFFHLLSNSCGAISCISDICNWGDTLTEIMAWGDTLPDLIMIC